MWRKDPDAVLDYHVDWSSWLTGGEVIVTSTWTVPTGLTKDSDSHSDTVATIWLSGGVVEAEYTLVNHIVTNSSPAREEDRSVTIKMVNR